MRYCNWDVCHSPLCQPHWLTKLVNEILPPEWRHRYCVSQSLDKEHNSTTLASAQAARGFYVQGAAIMARHELVYQELTK